MWKKPRDLNTGYTKCIVSTHQQHIMSTYKMQAQSLHKYLKHKAIVLLACRIQLCLLDFWKSCVCYFPVLKHACSIYYH